MSRLAEIRARLERKFSCAVDCMVLEDPDVMLSQWYRQANADMALLLEIVRIQSEALDDARYVFAGSRAIEGQDDATLDKRERSIMRLLECQDRVKALLTADQTKGEP